MLIPYSFKKTYFSQVKAWFQSFSEKSDFTRFKQHISKTSKSLISLNSKHWFYTTQKKNFNYFEEVIPVISLN